MEHPESPLLPLLFHAINFAILVGVLAYFIGKKGKPALRSFLEGAEGDIRTAGDRLAGAQRDLEAARVEHRGLGDRIRDLHASMEIRIAREKQAVLDGARQAAEHMVKEAEQHASQLVRRSIRDTLGEVLDGVLGKTRTTLATHLTPDVHERIEHRFSSTLSERKTLKWTS